jgi:hypothetical protein
MGANRLELQAHLDKETLVVMDQILLVLLEVMVAVVVLVVWELLLRELLVVMVVVAQPHQSQAHL